MKRSSSHMRMALIAAAGVLALPRSGDQAIEISPGAQEKLDAERRHADRMRQHERLPRSRVVDKTPLNGKGEVARRLRQIERGQLKAANGLKAEGSRLISTEPEGRAQKETP